MSNSIGEWAGRLNSCKKKMRARNLTAVKKRLRREQKRKGNKSDMNG